MPIMGLPLYYNINTFSLLFFLVVSCYWDVGSGSYLCLRGIASTGGFVCPTICVNPTPIIGNEQASYGFILINLKAVLCDHANDQDTDLYA